MTYVPAADRYDAMPYRRCGRSGLQLPAISLGLWHNFGDDTPARDASARSSAARSTSASPTSTSPTTTARRYGVGRDATSAASCASDFAPYRDELIISTKAGYDMWPGPYGEWGSRKYLLASLDQSLQRMGLDYVDIFYSHRFDPDTPLEETMGALDTAVRAGQGALRRHLLLLRPAHRARRPRSCASSARRCSSTSRRYSLLNRWIEEDLLDVLGEEGVGCIAFSPLAQGMLTDQVPRRHPRGLARRRRASSLTPDLLTERDARPRPRAQRDRRSGAARRSRRWRSPGCCATRASPRR